MSVSNAPTPRVTVLRPEVNQSDTADGNTSVRPRLLIVDDISDNRTILTRRLQRRGFDVVEAECGLTAIELIHKESFDLVLLDVMMPGINGIETLKRIREHGPTTHLPVIMLSAKTQLADKIRGFERGADDYVAKPFHLEEILARIRALLRRSAGHAKSELNCGSVRLDTRTGRVTVDGNPVKLTSHEYRLLSYLMHHTGRVVSRSELVEHLYDQDFDRDSNTIEVFVGRIRKKLGVDVIQTVRGLGYLLAAPGNAS